MLFRYNVQAAVLYQVKMVYRSGAVDRFDYYESLSAGQQQTYDRSDRVGEVRLRSAGAIVPLVEEVREALVTEKTRPVQQAMARLCDSLTGDLGVPPVGVKVLAKRPTRHGEELHGYYEPEDEGQRARIQVWMRTATHKRVVTFRTFLRTFLHELCHHLDYELYDLDETFHTKGFFKRESSLMRALAPAEQRPARKEKAPARPKKKAKAGRRKPEQMKLPFEK